MHLSQMILYACLTSHVCHLLHIAGYALHNGWSTACCSVHGVLSRTCCVCAGCVLGCTFVQIVCRACRCSMGVSLHVQCTWGTCRCGSGCRYGTRAWHGNVLMRNVFLRCRCMCWLCDHTVVKHDRKISELMCSMGYWQPAAGI